MKTLVFGVLGLCTFVFAGTETLFRYSLGFNRWVYEHSVVRDSDHFRLKYRLQVAALDPNPEKVGFIGTSITRDGIDVRKFQARFPQVTFYNLGGNYKIPEFERFLIERYSAARFHRLVYVISATDIMKFRERTGVSIYPSMQPFLNSALEGDFARLWEQRESLVNNLLSSLSETILFRQILFQSAQNALLAPLGLSPAIDFDFYWRQENIYDAEVLAQKLRYTERGEDYFQARLEKFAIDISHVAAQAQELDIRLIFYHLNNYCDDFRDQMPEYERESENQFGEILAALPKRYPNVRYHRAPAFACEDYAELFHFNERGREKAFQRISAILQPELERGR